MIIISIAVASVATSWLLYRACRAIDGEQS